MRKRRLVIAISLLSALSFLSTGITKAEPSFDQMARHILDVVKAFRAAYTLQVVEHTKAGGMSPREDWEKDPHFLPLPAQFVKAAAAQVGGLEIGLISLTPLNPENKPRTSAEVDALMQLSRDRLRGFISFVDGDQFKAVSADLGFVRSCIDCHNQHPQATRKNFQLGDMMGALVVRLKQDRVPSRPSDSMLPGEPPKRPPGTLERLTPPPTTAPPSLSDEPIM